MATEVTEPTFTGDSLPTTKAAVLLVVGEPISPAHKDLILAEIATGFQSWDVEGTDVDINEELASIANSASAGDEGPEAPIYGPLKGGERVIRRSSPIVQVEILVNPQLFNVRLGLKTFLTTPAQHKHLIYAGHGFQGSGAWILQDDIFTFQNFAQLFQDPDVENALKRQEGGTLSLHCFADGDWSRGNFAKQDFGKFLKISVNPEGKNVDNSGISRFVAYIGNFVEGRSLNKLLPASDVVGSIRFNKPTMYVFPACQGDSALFGISGFNLLVNGGYNRKACFWDLTRHLDRIDAMLLTHLGPDNLFGIGSVLERKAVGNIHPEVGYVYVNSIEKAKHSPNGDLAPEEGGLLKGSSLKINLSEECSRLMEYCKQIGQAPHPSTRASKGDHQDPVNLYHKVGHGSLDLYVLNPVQDSKEIKEYFQHWSKNAGQFGLNQGLPLQNVLSTCALLVWTPSNQTENITRIFFPGNAPQNKILEGLEKVKNLDFLKHATCSYKDLHAKPIRKGGIPTKTSRPASAKPPTLSSPRQSARREKTEREEKPKLPSTLKANKGIKEDNNKKVVKDKKDKQKSPNKTPEIAPIVASPVAANLMDMQPEQSAEEPISIGGSSTTEGTKTETEQDLLGQLSAESSIPPIEPVFGEPVNNNLDSPEPLPDPDSYQPGTVLMPVKAEETMAMVDEQLAMSKTTMEELGIYDDDAEFPENEIKQHQDVDIVNNIQNDFDKVEDEEPDNNIGAFENDNPEAEEIQPEALPEPIATPQCYASGPDVVPDQFEEVPVKIEPEDIVKEVQVSEDFAETSLTQNVRTKEEPELEEFDNREDTQNTDLRSEVPDKFSENIEQQSFQMNESVPGFESDAANFSENIEQQSFQMKESVPELEEFDNREDTQNTDLRSEVPDKFSENIEQQSFQMNESVPGFESDAANFSENIEQQSFQMKESVPGFESDAANYIGQDFDQSIENDEEVKSEEGESNEPSEYVERPDMSADNLGFEQTHEDHIEQDQTETVQADQVSADFSEKVDDDHTPVQSECNEDENLESSEAQQIETYPDQSKQEDIYPDGSQQEIQGDYLAEVNETQQTGLSADAETEETELTEQINSDSDEGIDATEIEIPHIKEEITSQEISASELQTEINQVPQNNDVTEIEPTALCTDAFANGHEAQEFEQFEESSIPAAFEKDETPELMVASSGPVIGQAELQSPLTPDSGEVSDLVPSGDDQLQEFEPKGETDSLEGDVENEKDIDEACDDVSRVSEANGFSQPSVNPQDTSNPFSSNGEEISDMHQTPLEQGGMNPFFGIDNSQKQLPTSGAHQFEDDLETDQINQPFNPLKEWGEPMGLPSPMLGDAATNGAAENKEKIPKAKSSKNGPSKTADAKTTKRPDPTKRPTPSKAPSKVTERKPASAPSKATKTLNGDSKPPRSLLSDKKASSKATNTVEKKLATKTSSRPATAPSRTESKKPAEKTEIPKAKPARRPASAATAKTSPPAIKTLPLPPHTTFYVDLTYIPAHGDPNYCDAEFFRRVRARHYVLSALSPTSHTLNCLMEAKKTWEDKDLQVTVIPSHDNEHLRYWMNLNKEKLQELKIEIAPAASRCTIQLQDHETSCSAYRMEF